MKRDAWRIQDAAQLRPALTTLFAAYRATLDDEALKAYWAGLRTVELEWVREACAVAVRAHSRLPAAAQLYALAGECRDQAQWDARAAAAPEPEVEPSEDVLRDHRMRLVALYNERRGVSALDYPETLTAVVGALTANSRPIGERSGPKRAGELLTDFARMASRAICT